MEIGPTQSPEPASAATPDPREKWDRWQFDYYYLRTAAGQLELSDMAKALQALTAGTTDRPANSATIS